jgi:hypothetical protein
MNEGMMFELQVTGLSETWTIRWTNLKFPSNPTQKTKSMSKALPLDKRISFTMPQRLALNSSDRIISTEGVYYRFAKFSVKNESPISLVFEGQSYFDALLLRPQLLESLSGNINQAVYCGGRDPTGSHLRYQPLLSEFVLVPKNNVSQKYFNSIRIADREKIQDWKVELNSEEDLELELWGLETPYPAQNNTVFRVFSHDWFKTGFLPERTTGSVHAMLFCGNSFNRNWADHKEVSSSIQFMPVIFTVNEKNPYPEIRYSYPKAVSGSQKSSQFQLYSTADVIEL